MESAEAVLRNLCQCPQPDDPEGCYCPTDHDDCPGAHEGVSDMGMFDSLYDADGDEWQTKAYECLCLTWQLGDTLGRPRLADDVSTYQVEVLGWPGAEDGYATVRDDVLVTIGTDRDPSLPLVGYRGALRGEGA